MHPSSPSADLFSDALYGSASAEPFFVVHFPGGLGSTTAHLRRLPRKGRAGGAYRSLLKHRVQGAALPAMHPSSPSDNLQLKNAKEKQETILISCFIILDAIGSMIDFTQGVFFPSIRCFAIFQIDPLRFVPYIQFLEIHIFYEVRYWVC